VVGVALALTVAGSTFGAPAVGATAATAKANPLAKVTVAGNVGEKPSVEFAKPLKVSTTAHRELSPGAGEKLRKGAKVTIDYVVINGRTGVELSSSYGQSPVAITLDPKVAVAGLVRSLVDTSVGTRAIVAIAPKEGLTKNLAGDGVKKNDTLVFVVDVKGVRVVLTQAKGEAVAPVVGLPTVKLAANGKPTITNPSSAAPAQLVAQPLIKGAGPVVAAGQSITVHYTGVIWTTGKQFDSSWDRGDSTEFAIGAGRVIKGWDEGLVGQTIGSQVLLVVPPDKGYGSAGNSGAGISGTDTLVFVVDILDAA
jgi:peptidylprolyl isomerase